MVNHVRINRKFGYILFYQLEHSSFTFDIQRKIIKSYPGVLLTTAKGVLVVKNPPANADAIRDVER